METWILTIDIGNTLTNVGLWDGQRIAKACRFQSSRYRTADEWGLWLRWMLQHLDIEVAAIDAIGVASVVPQMNNRVEEACRVYLQREPFFIGPGIRTGMPILYEDPKAVGADRIANAVAAYREFGGPCVVIDLGTATTFDVIRHDGAYLGGVIAPGIEISADALFHHAARLPRVEIRRPPGVIGRNTPHAMQAGIFYGYIGLIERIAREIEAVLGDETRFVATGGFAPLFQGTTPYMAVVEPYLTLRGIVYLLEMNRTHSS